MTIRPLNHLVARTLIITPVVCAVVGIGLGQPTHVVHAAGHATAAAAATACTALLKLSLSDLDISST